MLLDKEETQSLLQSLTTVRILHVIIILLGQDQVHLQDHHWQSFLFTQLQHKKTSKNRSRSRVLTSSESIAMLEEKACKKREEQEEKERKRKDRELKRAAKEEQKSKKVQERQAKQAEKQKKAEEKRTGGQK